MSHFEISFTFENHHYHGTVAVLHRPGHIQYTITPDDHDLREKLGTQVIHEFPHKPLQPSFPGETEQSEEYSRSVIAGLQQFLQKKTPPPTLPIS
jgi:hypothetical protein